MGEIPSSVFGIMSLIIVTLSGVVVQLYRQNGSLYKQISDLQTQRVAESHETRDKVAIPLQEIARYTELTYEKIMAGKR